MEEIVVVMSSNQTDDLDDYTSFESASHLNETFMSQVGFDSCLSLFYATFQCGPCNIFKKV